ncbi:MAG TPA: PDZ domain-containing protein, partial [Chitinophagaceae bacterium]|nr:PDZ domain-containing protein [Chitinophagaceae bacterium]
KSKEDKKDVKHKDVQHITITKSADADEKTVIEIKGDKVTINGKDAKSAEGVSVNVHKYKDAQAAARARVAQGGQNWNMDFDNNRISLFSEDANRAMLGVSTDENDKGAEINSVTKESAAEKAGLKKGDIITSIGSKKIEEPGDVAEAIRSHKPGDKVAITILRDGKEQKLNAELTKWKGIDMNTINTPSFKEFGITTPSKTLGAYMYDNRPKLGLSIQDTDDGKGVKVIELNSDGNAAKAGVKKDDIITHINDKEVNSADETAKVVKENKDKGSLRVQVNRAGKTQNIEVKMPRKLKTADL